MSSQATPARRRVLESGEGTVLAAFGHGEWALLVGLALTWGSSFLLIAIGLESFRPGVVSLLRVAMGAGTLALLPAARRPVDGGDWPRIALLGVLWIGIPFLLFPIAQQHVDTSVAGMINGAMPVASAVWATVLLRRLPGLRQRLGIAIGFVGIILVSAPELGDSRATAFGVVLLLASIVLYGLATNLVVPLQQRYGALPVILRAQLAALAVIAPVGMVHLDGSTWSWTAFGAMVPLGVLGTGLALSWMATLAGRVGGTRASIAIYLVPIVAIVLGVLVRDETVEPVALAGMALVLLGAWTTSRATDGT